MNNKKLGAIIVGATLILGGIGTFILTERIPTGYVGVQYSMAEGVSEELLTEGWHIVSPTRKVTLYSVATETFVMSADEREGSKENDSFDITCSDGTMNVDFEMQYTYLPENVTKVFKKYRGVDGNAVISSNLRSKIKTIVNEVLSDYTVLEAHLENKTEINKILTETLRERLNDYGIYVESATLPTTRVSKEVQVSIENRTKKSQELEAEKQEQEKAKLEAETKLIKAQADADANLIKAQAEADANRVLSESITENLIKMKEAEAREKHGWIEVAGVDSVVVADNNQK